MTEGTSRQASGRPDGLWGLTADQQWGVPAAADGGTQFMVKNGWLPSGSTGVWEINSIGEIVHDRQRMLIAVLSEGNATEDSGISFVQTVAETAANSVASAKG
jgi:hypothetical protein